MMRPLSILLLGLVDVSFGLPNAGLEILFLKQNRQYLYEIKTNISCGTLVPVETDSYWILEGNLLVQPFDNHTRVRLTLQGLKTALYSKNNGYVAHTSSDQLIALTDPWEVEYHQNGNINNLYVTPHEPLWTTNIKRALSINFQLRREIGTYYNDETCLYRSYVDCQVIYVNKDNKIRKYNPLQILSENSGYSSWMSVPKDFSKASYFGTPSFVENGPAEYNGPLDNIGTADRTYEMDDQIGLKTLDLKSMFEHRTRSHVLAVTTELSLTYDTDVPLEKLTNLNLTKTSKRYVGHDYSDPTNGIRSYTQDQLRSKTLDILLQVARHGIDADNIVRNASKIHNLELVNLLKTMSQLDYSALSKLFDDMVLGTSYETETSRNIYLEVLPHVRTNACARFIKYLVLEQKTKIEEATLLSLIRKLPFNVANHSQELLEELEVFTRLGLDYSQELRHAGILSFGTLVYKATEVRIVKQDYLENIVIKYFRMYNDCPQYIDRLVWLQGLSNIQYYIDSYLWNIYNNVNNNRHERFWAILATAPALASNSFPSTWHLLMDDTEHIQTRVAALHSFLSSKIKPSELLSVHNYIISCKDEQLKRFWYTTIRSLEESKDFNGYSVASNYITFLSNQVSNPDTLFWATGNHIVGRYDDRTSTGAMMQLMTVGDPLSGLPTMMQFRLKTVSELMSTSDIVVFIKAEGVATNMFKKIHSVSPKEMNLDILVGLLRKMKVQTIEKEKVHIEVVLKIHDKTVYATHFNQSRFDSWNGEDLIKTVDDFLKFGSHINQQVVYYPFQLDANIPTELGTPIRLQTAVVSFSSIRGNLTAPSIRNWTWKNDLHLRYLGTAVTSLCTDGPLLQSEHIVRVQQTVVAHLPMKFDISFSPSDRRLRLKWPNLSSQSTGLAMHSRAQISMDLVNHQDTYTVEIGDAGVVEDNGVFFDCNRPLTSSEVIGKIVTSNTAGYDFITKFHPTAPILNGLLFVTAPPSGSCGLVIGGRKHDALDSVLKVDISCETLDILNDDKMVVKLGNNLEYRERRPDGDVQMNASGLIQLESVGGNMTFNVEYSGEQTNFGAPGSKKWKFCVQQQDISHGPLDQDITPQPAAYDGFLTLSYGNEAADVCPLNGSHFLFQYKGVPHDQIEDSERFFEVKVSGSELPQLKGTFEDQLLLHPAFNQLVSSLQDAPLNLTAVIKEKNGLASLTLNNENKFKFKSENFAWILDSWSYMQIMKKFGIYRECRLLESTVHTLTGTLDRLPAVQCAESLALADCTDIPRFAIFRTKSGGLKVYTGGNHVTVNRAKDVPIIDFNGEIVPCAYGCEYPVGQLPDFRISILGDTVKVQSRISGIQVYHRRDETVILVPHSYMYSSCGSCVSQHYYNIC